jgi:hypothetical protein
LQNLSHLTNLSKGLQAAESMSAGNTISHDPDNFAMQAPGSAPVNPIPSTTDTPSLDVSETSSKPTTLVKPGHSIPSSGKWLKAGGE